MPNLLLLTVCCLCTKLRWEFWNRALYQSPLNLFSQPQHFQDQVSEVRLTALAVWAESTRGFSTGVNPGFGLQPQLSYSWPRNRPASDICLLVQALVSVLMLLFRNYQILQVLSLPKNTASKAMQTGPQWSRHKRQGLVLTCSLLSRPLQRSDHLKEGNWLLQPLLLYLCSKCQLEVLAKNF